MKKIPNIAFESSENTQSFELLDLAKLFARLPTIVDHNPTQPHRVSFFALLIVTKGTGIHQVDLIDYQLKAGTVLKIAKGQVHAFQKNAEYEGFLLLFTEDFILNHFSQSSINIISHLYNYHITSPIFNEENENSIFINQLLSELKNENTYARENIIAALLNLYLLKLERQSNGAKLENSNPKHHTVFIQFKNLVEAKYAETRNVKDYADAMFVSTKYLNQVVKEFTINTAKTFIDDYVTLEIKRATVTTNKSFKEIAFETGFDEVTNFTKFFKKNVHLSPKEFREQKT
ncbi:AraC family transcriptional regulator [Frigoriflavimonas asaccharolytica]|uniref:AraC-like DNA-binding protein n=1 Tax=Frigoriflavimonas asaccharolytica TaxID=2735899 RepID=A0A8J8GA24_9FLAO|nr:helix-turn-helix transcriptional regulator [Frigoriflavimonas asaccharolytica]NRS92110.1 AraC-like DNA-binding protein [Frigoriflavimonas asaccharolytica]